MQFIGTNLPAARKIAPLATIFVPVCGGYIAFNTQADYEVWQGFSVAK